MTGRLALHEAHEAAGAVFEDHHGRLLPAWYGSDETPTVALEYRAAREVAALADLSDRGVLVVTGPQRQKFLHSILSNEVAGLAPGQGRLAAFMDVKGHLLAFLRVLVTKDSVILEMPADRLDAVEKLLDHYRVAAPVRFAHSSAVVLSLLGPGGPGLLARLGIDAATERDSHSSGSINGHDVLVARAGDFPTGGFALHVPAEGAVAVWQALTAAAARPLGRRALDVLRIEDGQPWYGADVTEENLLHETGLVKEYHSPAKGCYVGQEVIARLEARGGHVNKLLRGLKLDAAVSRGARLVAEGREVGRVTTAGVSPRLGPIALAFVHRNHTATGAILDADGVRATVEALPMA